ncbi:MAG: potassium-transporting ATPase subunit KdpA [Bdellovibrionales bacterium]|nr:potassium-transporting ATPase subunit KdpA [Bdellovibrionales bacterium]
MGYTFSSEDGLQILLFFILLLGLAYPFSQIVARIYAGKSTWLDFLNPIERLAYRSIGVNPEREMTWREYAGALLSFNLLGILLLFVIQIFQAHLPLNPQKFANIPWALALNTAISFVTNTNWQAYSGEAVLSYFTQMVGLATQNFLSAATGMAVAVALIRGFVRRESRYIGNFWQDLVRSTVYVLMPICFIFALVMVQQGIPQNFSNYSTATTFEGATQVIPQGPAASQIAIKQLGTNGGGFFGVNSAHPFENPTPLTNFLQTWGILFLPTVFLFFFGRAVGDAKQSRALLGATLLLFVPLLLVALWAQFQANPALGGLPFLEGVETRIGIAGSTLWAAATTAASNGSVNAMHSSLSALAGGVAMLNMLLGEVVFGGVGAGLYGLLLFAILTVFLAGLMVGRTPEYLGKKIEIREVVLASIGILLPCAVVLFGSALAVSIEMGRSSLSHSGPHGLSEVLYAWGSAANNNGSAFAGLNANTSFYNLLLAVAMFIGRFAVILPCLAIAGSVANKKYVPASSGTFPTDGALFVLLLASVIIIVGALTYFPALTLGPVLEHLLQISGRTL